MVCRVTTSLQAERIKDSLFPGLWLHMLTSRPIYGTRCNFGRREFFIYENERYSTIYSNNARCQGEI